ncbi:MAG: pirin family protein [Rhodospirillaceae bacterium]
MSIILRPSRERGHATHGWLDSFHSFSFADYYDPEHMGFRALRVINDDVIQPGAGFGMHGHRDMEIITYIIRGALAHEDTTGGKGMIRRGEVQYMSAGTGVRHSEFNASGTEDARLLQIWIVPPREGLAPSYSQQSIPEASKLNTLRLIAAPDGADGSLITHRDVRVYAGLLEAGAGVSHRLEPGRGAWLQVVDGAIEVNNGEVNNGEVNNGEVNNGEVNGVTLAAGDGAAIENIENITLTARDRAEILLFDLD